MKEHHHTPQYMYILHCKSYLKRKTEKLKFHLIAINLLYFTICHGDRSKLKYI